MHSTFYDPFIYDTNAIHDFGTIHRVSPFLHSNVLCMSLAILTFSLYLEYPSFCDTVAMFKLPNSEVATIDA